jgi:hypothetical protein
MTNPYAPPTSELRINEGENTSGMGEDAVIPDGIKGWSWGAFFLSWIWAGFNKTYIGLLAFVPYVGIIMAVILGIKGREWAWRNKRWDSVEHFNRVQRRWSIAGLVLVFGAMALGIFAAIAIPFFAGTQS